MRQDIEARRFFERMLPAFRLHLFFSDIFVSS